MTTTLDLILLPLVRYYSQGKPEITGLHFGEPPRRVARGRSLDRLLIHFGQEGNAPLTPKMQNRLLKQLANTFYKSPGSATAALRSVAESLNDYLLERNLRNASRGQQTVGIVTLAVLRDGRLYMAQSGPSHFFRITKGGVEHYYDPDLSGRGLGRGRATTIRYNQFDLNSGDLMILTPRAPAVWTTTTLNGIQRLGLESLYTRLLHQVGPELNAVLIQTQPGSGDFRLIGPEELGSKEVAAKLEVEPQAVVPAVTVSSQSAPAETLPVERVTPAAVEEPAPEVDSVQKPESLVLSVGRRWLTAIGEVLTSMARALGNTLGQAFQGLATLLRRMLPDESLFTIPSSVMIFIAVAVPLVIVAMASVVYFQRGRETLYQGYFSKAQIAANQASQLEAPNELRVAWREVLTLVDSAEAYQETEESSSLRAYALTVLDGLDKVERLDFQAAIVGGLPRTAQITRMVVASNGDLYMLNATDGSVLRAEFGSQGYELDREFICGPMPQPLIVGPLVDIVPLPPGDEDQATLLGMDGNGNLIKCLPGGVLPLAFQMGPPDTNWGSPRAMDLDDNDLYVLDPMTNAVWIYWGRDGYRERPRFYFADQVPPMQGVIDLAVSSENLYLLHEDSHITTCTFSLLRETPTRCTDPAEFTDLRPGRESGENITDASFSQILHTQPPDPSIYLFDPQAHSIYHFSLRLTLQRQYQPQTSFSDEPATAFTIGPTRLVLLAIGDLVYFAALP